MAALRTAAQDRRAFGSAVRLMLRQVDHSPKLVDRVFSYVVGV
jgi:hypothetical protein